MYTNKAATLKLNRSSIYSNSLSVNGCSRLLNNSHKYQFHHLDKVCLTLKQEPNMKKQENDMNGYFAVIFQLCL